MWHRKSTHKTQNSHWLPLNHTLFVRQYIATKSRFAQKTRYQGALPICYFTSILEHWINDFSDEALPSMDVFSRQTYIILTRILLSDPIA